MEERPILMNEFSVRAILDGRKTQTRRVLKTSRRLRELGYGERPWPASGGLTYHAGAAWDDGSEERGAPIAHCPYGRPGDRLWVRETWRTLARYDSLKPSQVPEDARIWYDAGGLRGGVDVGEGAESGKTRPSIFMCRWMSRITLRVLSVRVERVQEISVSDCIAEGILPAEYMSNPCDVAEAAREDFRILWDSINADRGFSWSSNPWVWVVEFKLEGFELCGRVS